jgi:hypothetical protein
LHAATDVVKESGDPREDVVELRWLDIAWLHAQYAHALEAAALALLGDDRAGPKAALLPGFASLTRTRQ